MNDQTNVIMINVNDKISLQCNERPQPERGEPVLSAAHIVEQSDYLAKQVLNQSSFYKYY